MFHRVTFPPGASHHVRTFFCAIIALHSKDEKDPTAPGRKGTGRKNHTIEHFFFATLPDVFLIVHIKKKKQIK